MVKTQNNNIPVAVFAVAFAHFLRLGKHHALKALGRRRRFFGNVLREIPLIHLIRRQIDEPSLILHGICHQDVHHTGGIPHRFGLLIVPVEVRIVSSHKNREVGIDAFKNFIQTAGIIREVIFFKYPLIGLLFITAACQKIDSVSFFI